MYEKLYIQPGIWSVTSKINEVSRLKFSINVHSAGAPCPGSLLRAPKDRDIPFQEPTFLCVSECQVNEPLKGSGLFSNTINLKPLSCSLLPPPPPPLYSVMSTASVCGGICGSLVSTCFHCRYSTYQWSSVVCFLNWPRVINHVHNCETIVCTVPWHRRRLECTRWLYAFRDCLWSVVETSACRRNCWSCFKNLHCPTGQIKSVSAGMYLILVSQMAWFMKSLFCVEVKYSITLTTY